MQQPVSASLKRAPRGYVALVAILVIGAVGTVIAVSLLTLGVGSLRVGGNLADSVEAKALANACAERALQEIWNNGSFSGTNTLTIGNGTCTYTVTLGSGENRTVTASGTKGMVTRRVSIAVNRVTSSVGVASWREIAD